jgi:hypothetical protein
MSCCKNPSFFRRLLCWAFAPSTCASHPSCDDIAEFHTGTVFKVKNSDPQPRSNAEYFMIRLRDSDSDSDAVEYALFTKHAIEQAIERANKNPEHIPTEIRGNV